MMKRVVKHLRQLEKGVLTVSRYLYEDSVGERQARWYDDTLGRRKRGIQSRRRGPGEYSMDPRDLLELTILGGDRDEYIDKSFWHDAEARGITFDESRVDGT